jgi:hypothetical protein
MSRFKTALALAAVLATSAVALAHPGAHHSEHHGVRMALKAAPSM